MLRKLQYTENNIVKDHTMRGIWLNGNYCKTDTATTFKLPFLKSQFLQMLQTFYFLSVSILEPGDLLFHQDSPSLSLITH